jgi:hypothetical protein
MRHCLSSALACSTQNYASTKSGLFGLTMSLALETGYSPVAPSICSRSRSA